jgi:hypothetical protein
LCCSQPTGWQTKHTRSNLSSRQAPFENVENREIPRLRD